MTFSETFLVFLVTLVVFLGVKFGFRKSCLCKRNDKYEVCLLVVIITILFIIIINMIIMIAIIIIDMGSGDASSEPARPHRGEEDEPEGVAGHDRSELLSHDELSPPSYRNDWSQLHHHQNHNRGVTGKYNRPFKL